MEGGSFVWGNETSYFSGSFESYKKKGRIGSGYTGVIKIDWNVEPEKKVSDSIFFVQWKIRSGMEQKIKEVGFVKSKKN